MRNLRTLVIVTGCVLTATASARAWHDPGHAKATSTAVAACRAKLPGFFGAGAATIAHCALDPDAFTRPIAPPELHSAEAPEHYFDIELLQGTDVPPDRYAFIALCAAKQIPPPKIGLLPYAVAEWTQRLTVTFAEHRKWPNDPHIRAKCLVYAGLLAHYAQDLCQPLHTTIHYDGRAQADGSSPRSGIHLKVDALLHKPSIDVNELAALKPDRFEDLHAAVLAEFGRSHALVERVYELEQQLPEMAAPLAPAGEVERFAAERLTAAATFTASLYLSAWENSKSIVLPEWHQRPPTASK